MALPVYETLEIPGALMHLYHEMAISPMTLLQNYVLSQIAARIQKYETENRFFEQNYHCTFQEFQARVEKMDNAENFAWEDDLLDWEFAVENLGLWQNRANKIAKP